jgi:hypothetical protein
MASRHSQEKMAQGNNVNTVIDSLDFVAAMQRSLKNNFPYPVSYPPPKMLYSWPGNKPTGINSVPITVVRSDHTAAGHDNRNRKVRKVLLL